MASRSAKNKPQNAFYAQSGGVTAVINASACGVIETARKYPKKIGKVYAGRNGILGALAEELIDTSKESASTIAGLRSTPSGAFGSCRYKMRSLKENRREYERLIDVFRAHDIGYFFYNGGGDSQDTAHKVSQISSSMGFPITCIGIPKTVDNDLPHTDTCPGFGSVAKYVAIATREAALDVASMYETSTKVFILEVMGRHAGWIAAASCLAQEQTGDAPHLVLLPEVPFKQQDFLKRVKQCVESNGGKDAFGHTQLGGVAPVIANMVKNKHGYKYHWAVADYLQRAGRHIASGTDVKQAYAVGEAAVKFAIAGKNAVMPTIVRTSDAPYRWKIGEVALSKVANVEKPMPKKYISKDGYGITAAGRRYLAPLIQGEDYPTYKSGMPKYVRMKNLLVEKKLPGFKVG